MTLPLLEVAALLGFLPAVAVAPMSPLKDDAYVGSDAFAKFSGWVRDLGRRDARVALEALTYAVSVSLSQIPAGTSPGDAYVKQNLLDALEEQHDFLRRPKLERGMGNLSRETCPGVVAIP